MDHLRQRLEALEEEVRLVQRRLRRWRQLAGTGLVLALVCLLQPWGLAAQAPEEGQDRTLWQLMNLWGRVNALERTLTHVSSVTADGGRPEVVITGANLRIVNGLRGTATANGLGNLLVGYNEPRQGANERTGSHNVVVGQGHNFSSFGGLVVGRQNEIRGAFAAVSGGFDNTASGASAAVSGGIFNRASGASAAVSGGFDNTASGNAAAVSGGDGNTASGNAAAVSGGHGNTASAYTAAISGGEANMARGFSTSVSGGRNQVARGDFDWVAGSLSADE
jgi:trimeric autotransporter adhesin